MNNKSSGFSPIGVIPNPKSFAKFEGNAEELANYLDQQFKKAHTPQLSGKVLEHLSVISDK
jgi:hypothetical protein